MDGWLATALLCLAGFLWPTFASAQQDPYPSRPITFVSPYAAGGSGDGLCRLISSTLQKKLGQTVVHESKPGANTEIALVYAAKAKPDGYTLLCAPSPMVVNPQLFKETPYDPFRDFEPIGLAVTYNYVLFVSSTVPAKTVAEFIDLAKAQPGKLTYGTSGIGNGSHLGFEMLSHMAGIKLLQVPYKSSATVAVDGMAGRLSAVFDAASSIETLTAGGKMRALGSVFPVPKHPDLPLISRSLPGFSVTAWFGLVAPKGTPPTVIAKLSSALNETLREPAYEHQLKQSSMIPAAPGSPSEFADFMKGEYKRYGDLIRANNIRAER